MATVLPGVKVIVPPSNSPENLFGLHPTAPLSDPGGV